MWFVRRFRSSSETDRSESYTATPSSNPRQQQQTHAEHTSPTSPTTTPAYRPTRVDAVRSRKKVISAAFESPKGPRVAMKFPVMLESDKLPSKLLQEAVDTITPASRSKAKDTIAKEEAKRRLGEDAFEGPEAEATNPNVDLLGVSVSRFTIVSEELNGVQNFSTVEEVLGFCKKEHTCPFWVDVEGITENEMDALGAAFELHPVTQEDCIEEDTAISDEKWDAFTNYCFVIFDRLYGTKPSANRPSLDSLADMAEDRRLEQAPPGRKRPLCCSRRGKSRRQTPSVETVLEDTWKTTNLNVAVFPGCILSFHNTPLRTVQHVLYRVQSVFRGAVPSPDWVMYALLDGMVDSLVPLVTEMADFVDHLEQEVFVRGTQVYERLSAKAQLQKSSELLHSMGLARRRMSQLKRSFVSKREILTTLAKQPIQQISPPIRQYLMSVLNHVIWQVEKVEIAQETLNHLHANYLAQVNIEVAQASNEMNEVMKKLSAVATVTLPLTLLTSLFGMNVTIPGERTGELHWFWVLLSVCMIVIFCMMTMARRLDWL